MTREENRTIINEYCRTSKCLDCPLRNHECARYLAWDGPATDEDMEAILKLLQNSNRAKESPSKKEKDMINPDHYKVHANECIDEIQAMLTPEEFKGFLKGNFLKYRYRTGHKDDPEQEAAKSDWYMNKLMEVSR